MDLLGFGSLSTLATDSEALAGTKRPREDDGPSRGVTEFEAALWDMVSADAATMSERAKVAVQKAESVKTAAEQRDVFEMLLVEELPRHVVPALVKAGILACIKAWLKRAMEESDHARLRRMLEFIGGLAVDLEAIKASKIGSTIARLQSWSAGTGPGVEDAAAAKALADTIYDKWAAAAGGGSSSKSSKDKDKKKSSSSSSGASSKEARDKQSAAEDAKCKYEALAVAARRLAKGW